MRPEGLTIIRRINLPSEYPEVATKRLPVGTLSHEEVFKRYRGIDGEPWPEALGLRDITLEAGLASVRQYQAIETYFKRVSDEHLCDLLYLRFPRGAHETHLTPLDFAFLGFDYGFYSSEDNLYSSISNEVIYGLYGQMTSHAKLLNKNLLLPTLNTVAALSHTRDELLRNGADLETNDGPFVAIAVYGRE